MATVSRKSLGERLVEAGKITPQQLIKILVELKSNPGKRMGNLAVDMGFVTQAQLVEELSAQMGIPYRPISPKDLDHSLLLLFPLEVAEEMMAIPLSEKGGVLEVGMVDPLNIAQVDRIKNITKKSVRPLFATEDDIKVALTYAKEMDHQANLAHILGVSHK